MIYCGNQCKLPLLNYVIVQNNWNEYTGKAFNNIDVFSYSLLCELNITSFLTLPYPLHCPICAKDIMVIVVLLQAMQGWEGWRVVHLS